jgi:hypothetical protein
MDRVLLQGTLVRSPVPNSLPDIVIPALAGMTTVGVQWDADPHDVRLPDAPA